MQSMLNPKTNNIALAIQALKNDLHATLLQPPSTV